MAGACRHLRRPGRRVRFVTEQLDVLLLIEDELTSGAERDPAIAHHSVSRTALHQAPSGGLDAVLHYDKLFERYEHNSDGTITCHFADRTTAVADVVVGADGAGSRVRAQYLPDAERVDTGIKTIAGKYPLNDKTKALLPPRIWDGPNNVMPPKGCGKFIAPHDLGDGAVVTVDGIGGNDETLTHDGVLFENTNSYVMWVYAASAERYPTGADLSEMDGCELRDLVSGMITTWHPALRRLVADSPAESVSMLPIRTSVPVPRWETTNVTLLGDAIHSMTPFRGIGANTALRDAALLARNLIAAARGERELLEAISDYEAQMTGYGFTAVRDSLRTARQFISDNRVGRTIFKTVLRFFSAVPPLNRKVFSDQGSK